MSGSKKSTESLRAPEVKILDHWEEIHLPFRIGSGRDFPKNVLRMAFFKDRNDKALVGKVWVGPDLIGPPEHVHGGVSCYVLDEAMGSVAWANGYGVMAKELSFSLQKLWPIGLDSDLKAEVVKVEGKNVFCEGKVYNKDTGETYVAGKGHFVRVPKEMLVKFVGQEPTGYDWNQVKP